MTQPGELQQKVQRLDNDVQAIYELLGVIRTGQQQQDKVLEEQSKSMARISAMQPRHANRLDGIDTRLEKIDGRFDRTDPRLDAIVGLLEKGSARQ